MVDLHISEEAQHDLQDIAVYLNVDVGRPQAAAHTLKRLTERMRSLQSKPRIGPSLNSIVERRSNYRYLTTDGYLIFYRIESDGIYIDRVLSSKRNFVHILFGNAHSDD